MIKSLNILLLCCLSLLIHCNDDDNIKPSLAISNLKYEPSIIPIRQYENTFIVTGTIDFSNAQSGVSKVRMTTSTGINLTVPIQGSTQQTSGTVSGNFEFIAPTTPATYTFQVWVIDGRGNESNKLSGSIKIIIDNSAKNWNASFAPVDNLNKVIWGNNKFVAVGGSGAILTSFDGMNWITEVSNTTSDINGITWTGTQFIAVGSNGTILSSIDGTIWEQQAVGLTESNLFAVAWSGTNFTVVGNKFHENETEILNSTDGIKWYSNTYEVADGSLFSIVWSGYLFVTVGYVPGKSLILTSPDGINWTNKSLDNGGYLLWDVIWSGSRFVSIGGAVAATSTDGITWNSKNISGVWALRGLTAIGPNKFVAAGNGIFTSTDGLNWVELGPGNGNKSIAWSGINYVVVGNWEFIYVSP